MRFLKKIQSLPEKKRKIILWLIVAVFAAGLLFWWVNNIQNRLAGFQGEEFIKGLNMPKIEMPQIPEISEEEVEKLKEVLEKNGQ